MSITAAQVKALRERTGAGMMECKKALVAADGDIEKAIAVMRKAGQAKAAKKAGRIAAEGVIAIAISIDNKAAFMVEVNTETDFAARNENFKAFVTRVVDRGLEEQAVDLPSLLAVTIAIASETTIAQECAALIAKIGENIQIRRMALLKSEGMVATYCHAGKIGVMVELSNENKELGKDIAMHIAASKPEVVAPEDLPAAAIEKEKDIYMAQAQLSGKPAAIVEKMVAGRIKKFMQEVSLLEQPFVKDSNITVGELLNKSNARVESFVRFEVGK